MNKWKNAQVVSVGSACAFLHESATRNTSADSNKFFIKKQEGKAKNFPKKRKAKNIPKKGKAKNFPQTSFFCFFSQDFDWENFFISKE